VTPNHSRLRSPKKSTLSLSESHLSSVSENTLPNRISSRSWIGVLATLLGAFMAVLDIQVTNASLNDITGSLGATIDEGSWISTGYLMAEIVVIPLSGWLSAVFSVRRYLLANVACFLMFSVLCAFATNLPMMIIFRAGQGVCGGVLIPMAFTVILTTLPPSKQAIGLALFSITATFAPTIGPTIGGWLTDNYGWEYIFYLNLIPGVIMLAGVWYGIAAKPMQLQLLKNGDWWGIATMAIGFASFEFFAEEGDRMDWFSSSVIQRAAIIAAIMLPSFVVIQLIRKRPLVNLRLLARRNFGLSIILVMTLGMGLYGSTFILPLFLAEVPQYNAMQIGETIMWVGIPQLFITPFISWLMKRIDLRLLIAIGLSLFGTRCLMNSHLTHDSTMVELIPSQIVRALGMPLILAPLSSISTAGIEADQISSASTIYNMTRNLGGSIGIAILETLQSEREKFHSNRLVDAISLSDPVVRDRIQQLTQLFSSHTGDPVLAQDQAYATLSQTVHREATVMSFNDCFLFMGYALFASACLVLLLRKTKSPAQAIDH
jgi:MFS transporter, DHA2 family, multidrug resistance protein